MAGLKGTVLRWNLLALKQDWTPQVSCLHCVTVISSWMLSRSHFSIVVKPILFKLLFHIVIIRFFYSRWAICQSSSREPVIQYSPKIMHVQELLFASTSRSSSCGWLRVAWAWVLETARTSLRFFAVTLWKERDRVRVSENAKWSESTVKSQLKI